MDASPLESTTVDPVASATAAGLRYFPDERPGYTRRRRGKGFAYFDAGGRPIREEERLARLHALAIPPAWTDVWICPDENGHLQATGRDARGRKQYLYHPRWLEARSETKFEKLLAFAAALPHIRRRVEQDLALPGMPRQKVLAAIVRLLETTLIRVGNDEYARSNDSFGLTTLHNDHARVEGTSVRFRFKGKSGIEHDIALHDRRLARIVQRCQELPGQELFAYVDESGQAHDVTSADVNDYLRAITQQELTAKDFRTWAGTVGAMHALAAIGPATTATATRRNLGQAVKRVARQLGNTPTVCRKYYIHPAVLQAYSDGTLPALLPGGSATDGWDGAGLHPREVVVLEFLSARVAESPHAERAR